MSNPHTAPTRTLPDRGSLAQLRKQAKELLKAFRAGEPGAVAEVRQLERRPDAAAFALADAQRVLARAYGFSSWAGLKHHVELAHGAHVKVEHVAAYGDLETARAILAGRVPARSLNVREPSRTDLAEQMLWAAGSCDPEVVRLCLPHVRRKRDDPWWNHVLMHATLPESFEMLLDHGVDPDVAGADGHTPLHHLAAVETVAERAQRRITEQDRLTLATLLLDAGASLEQRDALLWSTPLGWACRWGRFDLAEVLLSRGADPVEADAEPWARPLAWAEKCGHHEVIELLRSHGAK